MSQKAHQQEHRGFLSARKEWIKQHNQGGPERKRLLSKQELLESRKQLNLKKTTGGKFIAPKRQFVASDAWDASIHGEYDPSKEVTETLFGKEVKGMWTLKGRRGVFDFEEYQDAAVEEQENIHDSRDAPFSEQGLARKKKAVMDHFSQGAQARDKVAVASSGAELSLDSLVATLQQGGFMQQAATTPATAASVTDPVGGKDGSSSEDSSDGDSEEDKEDAAETFFGPTKKKNPTQVPKAAPAKGKKAVTPTAVQNPPPQKNKATESRRVSTTSKKSEQTKVPQRQDTQDSASSTLLADGRAQRALRNLKDKLAELQGKLANVALDDKPPQPDAHSQAAWKQSCVERSNEAKVLGRQAKEYIKRMDKSANKEFFEQDVASLQDLERACTAVQALFTSMSQSTSSPDCVVQAFQDTQECLDMLSVESLGTCFQLKYALAKASQSCLYSDYAKCCEQFLRTSEDMKNLEENLGRQSLEEFVVQEMESRVLLNLRAIKPSDAQAFAAAKDDIQNLQEAVAICEAVCKASKAHGNDFLGLSLQKSCELATGLVSSADLSLTRTALEDLDGEFEDGENGDGIYQFFKTHTVGQSLVDAATGRVSSGENEADAMDSLKKLEHELSVLSSVAFAGDVKGLTLISTYLKPTQDCFDECDKKVKSLKVAKGKGGQTQTAGQTGATKQSNKSYERLKDLLAGHAKQFDQETTRLLRSELQANLCVNVCHDSISSNLYLWFL